MQAIVARNPEFVMKLSVASMLLSLSIAKLERYRSGLLEDMRANYQAQKYITEGYDLYAAEALYLAEDLMTVADEADKLMMEWYDSNDERRTYNSPVSEGWDIPSQE